ncbi:hypothetical protein BaRGS_00027129 [Batillaria attramentaria]|uniref:Uncharacterized protein n=1 Tax=Batillaria attramentaria TaxID=370345 RepID=A0ABD0K3T4_9CAEN
MDRLMADFVKRLTSRLRSTQDKLTANKPPFYHGQIKGGKNDQRKGHKRRQAWLKNLGVSCKLKVNAIFSFKQRCLFTDRIATKEYSQHTKANRKHQT